jgi:hypothetical protein
MSAESLDAAGGQGVVGSGRLIDDPLRDARGLALSRESAQPAKTYVQGKDREADGGDEQEKTPPPAWHREVPLQDQAGHGYNDPKSEHGEDRHDLVALCPVHEPD